MLCRLFDASELSDHWPWAVDQVNHTLTRRAGTVRGFHFQYAPHAEPKLVMCLRGSIVDVAVDLRVQAARVGALHAQELSAENGLMMLIPPGCAHGFQTLTDDVELLYVHGHPYWPSAEGGIHHADPDIGFTWPLPVTQISDRDAQLPTLAQLQSHGFNQT